MPAITRVAILFCGQGMATVVEYYPDGDVTEAPQNLALIDFGGNKKYSENASDYIVQKLQAQALAGWTPEFDLVVISHQDGDHLSMLGALTQAIKAGGIEVQCSNFFLGGLLWSKRNMNRVQAFADAMEDDEEASDSLAFNAPHESDYTGVSTRADLGNLVQFGSTFIRNVTSGLKLSKAKEDIARNASSAVIVVENGRWSMMLPGDATYHTMQEVNDLYDEWAGTNLIPQVFALEIPHHGALRTAVENYTAQTPLSKLDFTILTNFAKNTAPKGVVASAGIKNSHCHPLQEVLQIFDKSLSASPTHTYVAYVFDMKKTNKNQGWKQFDSLKSLRTTCYQINGTVMYGNWYYDLTDPVDGVQAEPRVTFQPLGRLEDLEAEFARDAEASWATKSPRPDEPLRAPPPTKAERAR